MQVSPPVWIFAIVAWAGSVVLLVVAYRRYADPTTPVPLVAAAGLVVLTGVYRRRTNEDMLDVRAAASEHADITFRRLFTGWLTIGLGDLALIDVARILG